MLKKLVLATAGVGFLILGVLGLALPFLPGVLFLLLAAVCLAALSPRLQGFLSRHPRLARFFRRVEEGRHLALATRVRLAFWAGLEALSGTRVR